ncbi:MAG: pentapeptide repeat-containing protein [Oligoflexia bacterium]|nr:pentapeptide repeat-containing protein [Oligoflexia bacterium]
MAVNLQELLENGDVEGFNAQRPSGKIDLYAADLPGAKLPGIDLSGANLENADLSGADLTDAMLARTRLCGADCTGAIFDGIMALKSNWRGAYLGQADLTGAELTAADFTDAELPEAILDDATLMSAKLNGSDLTGARLARAMLSEARLNGAKLVGSDLSGASLDEASLLEADLSKANLAGADFTQARLASAVLLGADLTGAVLRSVDLTGADLRGAKLSGADLRRADLTDAKLDDVDLSQADLTDAQLDPDIAAAVGLKPSTLTLPDTIWVEEPAFSVNNDRVALLWENEEEGGNRIRVLAGPIRGKRPKKAYALPVPADLVLSKTIMPATDGFMAMALVERPAGTMAVLCPIARDGTPGAARTLRLPFTPLVRPVLRVEDGETRLYGISREGPGLHVLRVTEDGLESIHVSRMSTARGFVSANDPVVLSKGGVLVVLRAEGPDQPVSAPASFPGRSPCAATVNGGVALAWALRGKPGFFFEIARPATPSDPIRLLPEDLAGTLDLVGDGDAAWVAWTQEAIRPGAPSTAWVSRLPGGRAQEIALPDAEDCGDIRFCTGRCGKNADPCVAVSTGDGAWTLVTIGKAGPKPRWSTATRT